MPVRCIAWQGTWLDAESPRHCRRLISKDADFEVTSGRIFAPESAPDETQAEMTREKARQLLLARQRQAEAELIAQSMVLETGHKAGIATVRRQPSVASLSPLHTRL